MLLNLNGHALKAIEPGQLFFVIIASAMYHHLHEYVSSGYHRSLIVNCSKNKERKKKKEEKNTHGLIQGPEGRLERGMENGNIKVR